MSLSVLRANIRFLYGINARPTHLITQRALYPFTHGANFVNCKRIKKVNIRKRKNMPCRVCTSSSKRDNEKFHVLGLFILLALVLAL